MLKTIKNLFYLAIVIAFIIVSWKIYRSTEEHPTLTQEQRADQREAQHRSAVAIRLKELEDTNGAGRVRMNRETENEARVIYNTRHPSNTLPML